MRSHALIYELGNVVYEKRKEPLKRKGLTTLKCKASTILMQLIHSLIVHWQLHQQTNAVLR